MGRPPHEYITRHKTALPDHHLLRGLATTADEWAEWLSEEGDELRRAVADARARVGKRRQRLDHRALSRLGAAYGDDGVQIVRAVRYLNRPFADADKQDFERALGEVSPTTTNEDNLFEVFVRAQIVTAAIRSGWSLSDVTFVAGTDGKRYYPEYRLEYGHDGLQCTIGQTLKCEDRIARDLQAASVGGRQARPDVVISFSQPGKPRHLVLGDAKHYEESSVRKAFDKMGSYLYAFGDVLSPIAPRATLFFSSRHTIAKICGQDRGSALDALRSTADMPPSILAFDGKDYVFDRNAPDEGDTLCAWFRGLTERVREAVSARPLK